MLVVAALLRGAILYRAPVFATGDSEGYLAPGFALARGVEFDLASKRTPGYPWLVAFAIVVGGEDLRSLVFVQHALGVLTAGLTFALGRLCFTPARSGGSSALGAGLLVALNGGLILSEHTVMTEALFVPLIVGALTALVAALRSSSLRAVRAGRAAARPRDADAAGRPGADPDRPAGDPARLSRPGDRRCCARRWRSARSGWCWRPG